MQIPFLWPALGFALGTFLQNQFPGHETGAWAVFASSLGLLWITRGRTIFPFLLILNFACLGNLFAYHSALRPANAVEKSAGQNHRIYLEGLAATGPEIKQTGNKQNVSFVLSTEKVSQWNGKNLTGSP